MTTYTNASTALPALAHTLLEEGDEVGSRDGDSRSRIMEIIHEQITLGRPEQREILTPGRGANLYAQMAETMWVLSGRNDVAWLERYLPRAADFSDDGDLWRGGYGPRLRHWGPDGLDQIQNAINLLREDPLTRRAVIQIYNPSLDSMPGKDIPCNNWIHFLSRNGKLYTHVAIRSNDLIWGWSGINAFEWSVLAEIVAGELGIWLGPITFSISSLHCYDRHWKKLARLASARLDGDPHAALAEPIRYHGQRGTWYILINKWMSLEARISGYRESNHELMADIAAFPEPMLKMWLYGMMTYWRGVPLPATYRGTAFALAASSSSRFTAYNKEH